jgi:RNA polymerase sigma-70 factor (ECF subfamily)
VHCEAATWADTDWPQILALYSLLAAIDSSPIVRLNRAIALRYVDGAEAALYEVESLAKSLSRYYLFHATGAALLRELGRTAEGDRAEMEGIDLIKNSAERALMVVRLADSPQACGVTLHHPAPIAGA